MPNLVTDTANHLATSTSRRGFLARSSRVLLGLVGGAALLELTNKPAYAQSSRFPVQAKLDQMTQMEADNALVAAGCCYCWQSCCSPYCHSCGPKIVRIYDCPCGCGSHCSYYYVCGSLYCT